ncbi:junctional adhesion molecule B-like, partial [Scleropages formosus]
LSGEKCVFLSTGPGVILVTVSTRKPKVEVQENEDAILYCEFKTEHDSNPRIEWKRKDKDVSLLYYKKQFMGNFAGRAKIEGATVTLQKVTYKDAGVYHCEITASMDDVKLGETNVTLRVLVAPGIPSCDIPSFALSGSLVELHCKDKHSVPPATYKWYKDKKLLTPSGLPNISYTIDPKTGTLRFKSVSRASSGKYHCEASNGIGKPKTCEAKHMKIDDLNITVIIAGTVGGFLLICLCVVGACCIRRKGCCQKDNREGRRKTSDIPSPLSCEQLSTVALRMTVEERTINTL